MGFDVFSALQLCAGVAIFLFGMSTLSDGLGKTTGGRLERVLERCSGNILKGVLFGAIVTAVIQSSSATTVMVVGFVNAGIMRLPQAIGVIMGANIGTTITAQILRLSALSGDSLFIRLLKPSSFAPILLAVGVALFLFSSRRHRHWSDVGQILLGLGLLFFGMNTMEGAVKGLASSPEISNLFATLSNPLLGVLVGMLVTAVLQSSSASIGILQALSSTGAIRFSAAAPIILGQNIGTCITVVLASIGASRNAKRAAAVHLLFNIIGTGVFLIGIYMIRSLLPFWNDVATTGMIANFHTVFNVLTTLLFLPFCRLLERLTTLILPPLEENQEEMAMLDERFLNSPSLALDRAHDALTQMGHCASRNFQDVRPLLYEFNERKMDRICEREDTIDRFEVRLLRYLTMQNERNLSDEEVLLQLALLHATGDIERIGDHVINVARMAEELSHSQKSLSEAACAELDCLFSAIAEILELTVRCHEQKDALSARRIEPLEEVVDMLVEILKSKHIDRLKRGQCSAEVGACYLEILISLERIADHCSNVALYIIQGYGLSRRGAASFDAHEYVRHLHESGGEEYNAYFQEYENIYIPQLREVERRLGGTEGPGQLYKV